jgi:hypothetical protein
MLWFLTLAALTATPALSHDTGQKDPDALKTVRSALDASCNNLESGIGRGTFRHYEREGGAEQWKLMNEASVEVHFAGSKFHILLEFTESHTPVKLDRQIIVYDGSAVFTNRFSKQIRPFGSEASVYAPRPDPAILVKPVRAGFPWDVTKLGASIFDINRVIEILGEDDVTITKTPDGDYVGERKQGRSGKVIVEWPRQYGYNVALRRSTVDGEPVREHVATWRKSGGVWYVDTLTDWGRYRAPSWVLEARSELEYDDFEVNAEVSPDLFTMEALEMPSGSRILDQSPEVKQPIHFVPYEDEEIEAKLGDMVSQVESLPTEWQPAENAEPRRNSAKIMIVLANVIIIAAIVVLVVVRRRRASR